MKRKNVYLAVLIAGISLNGFAQITIDTKDMPSSGDTLRYSNIDPQKIDSITNTGANYFWDFSDLKATSQDVTEYKPSSKTPYAFYFIGANKFGVKTADSISLGIATLYDLYDFYENTSKQFVIEGRGLKYSGFPIGSYYSDKDEIYQFPLKYGDRDSSTYRYSMDLATLIGYTSSGYRINEVDGWGTIKTPYGTFSCLRLKSTLYSNDTIKVSGFPIGFPSKSITYQWLAKGEKLPVLEVSGSDGIAGFTINSARFRDTYRLTYDPQAPVADFSADKTKTTTIDPVTFTNNSKNAGLIPNYAWSFKPTTVSFQNGTDAASKNPEVIFEKAGTYSVSLKVSRLTGQSHDTTFTNYIEVIDAKTLAPVVNFSASTTTPGVNQWIDMINNTTNASNATFEWSFYPDKITYLNGTDKNSKDPSIMITEGGYFNVTLKAENHYGKHDTTQMNFFYVNGTSGVVEQNQIFKIWPNPAKESIFINRINSDNALLNIYSSDAKLVLSTTLRKSFTKIDLTGLKKGVYIVELVNNKGHFYQQLIK